jgi:membrane protein YqaA with SNARE-associated domain
MASSVDTSISAREITAVPATSGAEPIGYRPARWRLATRPRLRRLLDMVHAWAESGWATAAIGCWALLQASVVPGPVETFFLPLAIADRRRVWRFAAVAIAGSTVGAVVAFAIGHFAFDSMGIRVLSLLGFDTGDVAYTRTLFAAHGWMLVILSTVTPISLKLTSIAAGAFGVPLGRFAACVFAGRCVRFVVTAAVVCCAARSDSSIALPSSIATDQEKDAAHPTGDLDRSKRERRRRRRPQKTQKLQRVPVAGRTPHTE